MRQTMQFEMEKVPKIWISKSDFGSKDFFFHKKSECSYNLSRTIMSHKRFVTAAFASIHV